jgi:hydrogenase/urease accessory protein HupE
VKPIVSLTRRVDMQKSFTATLMAVFAMAAVTLYAPRASAHTIGLSTGEYTAKGSSVVGKLAFARGEVANLVPSIDANSDGHLTASEVEAARGTLKDKVFGRISVTAGGAACSPVITDAGLTDQDGLLLSGRWDCPSFEKASEKPSDKAFGVELAILSDLSRGHRHVARSIGGGATHDQVLFGDERKFEIAAELATGAQAKNEGEATPAAEGAHKAGFLAFFKMGIEHILTGYDHLVFILGLILARARLRSLLTVVTAFTVAHSITLALAVMNVWVPSSRIIEPAIALSIAYVGIENFFVKDASKRWRITFPFGLIHGFGFAGALREINLPARTIPMALVSFNLGVEAGQLAVLALLLPLVLFLREKTWFEPRGVRLVSGAVALAGGIWFVARVVSG